MPSETEAKLAATSPADPKNKGRQRSPAFRKGLILKLGQLSSSRWQVSDTMNIFDDLQGIVELDSDAFLQPLEKLAEDHHG